jgi:hypothetical protein
VISVVYEPFFRPLPVRYVVDDALIAGRVPIREMPLRNGNEAPENAAVLPPHLDLQVSDRTLR